jgi:hypothetical protein
LEGGDEVERRNQLLRVSESMWAFTRGIRGTAAYWASKKQHLHAMIRSLGVPTLFLTLSSDDLGWADMQLALAPEGTALGSEAERDAYLAQLTPSKRAKQLAASPIIAARHFQRRFDILLRWMRGPEEPLCPILDFWWRIEFQRRGSPHVHGFLWCSDVPASNTAEGRAVMPAYIDRLVSATIPPLELEPELHRLVTSRQTHRHSHSCRVEGQPANHCRFRVPFQVCGVPLKWWWGSS